MAKNTRTSQKYFNTGVGGARCKSCILCIYVTVNFVLLFLQISTSCAWAQRQLMSVVLHRFGSQKFGKP